MTGEFCCVPTCANSRMKTLSQGKRLSYFAFPTDKKKKTAWLRRIRRMNHDGSAWQPTKYSRVCSEHFTDGKYFKYHDNIRIFMQTTPNVDIAECSAMSIIICST